MIKINPPRSNDKIHLDQAWYRLIEAITTTVEPNSVATLAALAALDDVPDGNGRVVRSLKAIWMRNASSAATADGVTVIVSADGGRWIRQVQIDPSWGAQATWYINPTTGDDEHTGATSGEALATISEFSRRMNDIPLQQMTTVWIEESLPNTDILDITVRPEDYTLTIKGVRNLELEAQIATWSRDISQTPPNNNNPGTISFAGWTPADHVARLVRMVNGAAAGMDAWVAADLGGGLARVGTFVNGTSWSSAEPVAGNIARIYSLPSITIRGLSSTMGTSFTAIQLEDLHVEAPGIYPNSAINTYVCFCVTCHFDYVALLATASYLNNCSGSLEAYADCVMVAGVYLYVRQFGANIETGGGSTGTIVIFQDGYPSLGWDFGLTVGGAAFKAHNGIGFFSNSITDFAANVQDGASLIFRDRLVGVCPNGIFLEPDSTLLLGTTAALTPAMSCSQYDIQTRALAAEIPFTGIPFLRPHMGIRILSTNQYEPKGVMGGITSDHVCGIKGPLTAGVTVYALEDLTESAYELPRLVMQNATIGNLYIRLRVAPGAAASGKYITVTVVKNGADTALSCSIVDDALAAIDTNPHMFVVAPGDRISVKVVTSADPNFNAEDLSVGYTIG